MLRRLQSRPILPTTLAWQDFQKRFEQIVSVYIAIYLDLRKLCGNMLKIDDKK